MSVDDITKWLDESDRSWALRHGSIPYSNQALRTAVEAMQSVINICRNMDEVDHLEKIERYTLEDLATIRKTLEIAEVKE